MKIKFSCVLLSIYSYLPQVLAQEVDSVNVATKDSVDFPADWSGSYEGVLKIYNGEGMKQELHMELSILPDEKKEGNYSWTVQYGKTAEGIRPYSIVPIDPEKGGIRN